MGGVFPPERLMVAFLYANVLASQIGNKISLMRPENLARLQIWLDFSFLWPTIVWAGPDAELHHGPGVDPEPAGQRRSPAAPPHWQRLVCPVLAEVSHRRLFVAKAARLNLNRGAGDGPLSVENGGEI